MVIFARHGISSTDVILTVFTVVYLGMILGGIPGLKLDRTGITLLGAIVLVSGGWISETAAWNAVSFPTIGLLLGLMIVSAQFDLSGAYHQMAKYLINLKMKPRGLLGLITLLGGVLAAILTNAVICLALAPGLVQICRRRGLNPTPFLFALAFGANVGSAATLIGSPQNILIGQRLKIGFAQFLLQAAVPTILGLVVVWLGIALMYRHRMHVPAVEDAVASPAATADQRPDETVKGLVLVAILLFAFVFTHLPQELLALAAAGILLVNRNYNTRQILRLVDWQLLVLFSSLFIVNAAMESTGVQNQLVAWLAVRGIDLRHPGVLFVVAAVLSDVVSNVPAVMVLLPFASGVKAGIALAMASALSSNIVVTGSMANIIAVDAAARSGVEITPGEFFRTGILITAVTLFIAAAWLCLL